MWKLMGTTFLLVGLAGLLGYWVGARGVAEEAAVAVDAGEPEVDITEPKLKNSDPKGRLGSRDLRRMIRTDKAIKSFTLSWAVNPDGLFENTWLGVPAIQNPLDVWITQEIMHEVKPDFVVETGTLEGGSAAIWATFLEQINPEAKVITIDILDIVTTAKKLPVVQRRVEFLIGDSVSHEIVGEVTERVAGSKVMVILDSSHTEEHVLNELRAYSPLVSVGSYLIVQDTGSSIPRYERWGGVRSDVAGADRAVRTFMAGNREFQTDQGRERLLLTNNPSGFLKRIR